jgi:PAS domain S-box-containing protein
MRKAFTDALIFAAAYLIAAVVGQSLSFGSAGAMAVWPPSGVFLATLVCTAPRRWPLFVAAALVAGTGFEMVVREQPLAIALGFWLAASAEALFGAALVQMWAGAEVSLARLRHLLLWTAFAGLAAPLVGATLGQATIATALPESAHAGNVWLQWWLADLVGVMTFGPLAWWVIQRGRGLLESVAAARAVEAGLMAVIVAASAEAVFAGATVGLHPFLLMPLLLWPAIRFGVPGVSIMVVMLTAIAITNTWDGSGPFSEPMFDPAASMMMVQVFCVIHAFTFYVLAAIFDERRRAEQALRETNAQLEMRVQDRTVQLEATSDRLRAQRDRYQAAIRSSGHVLYDTDLRTGHVIYGGDCERILGYTPEELEGDASKWRALVHPEELPQYMRAIGATANAPGFHLVYRARRRDGAYITVQDDGHRVAGGEPGHPGHMIGFVKDVTQQHRAQAALRDSERRLREMADAMPQIVYVARPGGDVEYINQRWFQFTGLSTEQSLGNGWLRALHPQDRERVYRRLSHSWETGEVYEDEVRYRRADGAYRWFLSRTVPVRNDAGAVTLWVGASTDVDDFKRLSHALQASEERFRVAQELSLFGFAILRCVRGADGAVLDFEWEYVNPAACRILQRPAAGLVGKRLLEVLPGTRNRSDLFDLYVRVVGTGRSSDVELYYDAEGIRGWFRNMTVKLGDGVAVSFTDITHRKLLEDALRQRNEALMEADRRKDEFLATLAHELRNPLAPIRTSLEIMRLAGDNGAAVERARAMMERQLAQMVRLVDDLLDLSRISHNRLQLRKEAVTLQAVLDSAVETSRPLIDEREHELILDMPPEPVWLDADLTRLAQVFVNLLNNAAKYTEPRGRIALHARKEQGEAVVKVEDNGVGIPAEMMPRIFDMFTQVDRRLERTQGGLGIGLTLVRRLVELHGGQISADSKRGQGSVFSVRLPVAAQPADASAGTHAADEPSPRRDVRILVVDDNRDAALSLATFLRITGNEVRTAHDGNDAIAAATSFRPHVMVLDIGMPGRNGYDVARHMREQPWGKDILLVAVTGWGQDEDRRRSDEAGFDAHLVKPIDPAEIERLLAQRQKTAA